MFKTPFSFKGRIRRTEFGITYLLYIGGCTILALLTKPDSLGVVLAFLNILLLWFLFAQGAKRCHDRGNSGWYLLIPFYVFWMLFADSEYGPNRFGPNPKGLGNDAPDDYGDHLIDNTQTGI